VGVATAAGAYNLGTCANGFGYGGSGKSSNDSKFVDYGVPYAEVGDAFMCVCHDSFMCVCHDSFMCVCHDSFMCVCHDLFMCVCHDSFMWV